MADILFRKKTITAAVETTYGTDEVPVATNAIETYNLSLQPYDGPRITREQDRLYQGSREEINVSPQYSYSFEAEVCGSGAAGTAPNIDPFLQCSAHDATIVAATSVTYAPVSTDESAGTSAYFYWDGQLHKLIGCRTGLQLSMSAQEKPMWSVSGIAFYDQPTEVALPTPTYTNAGTVLPMTKGNTQVTLDGYSVVLQNLQINWGQQPILEDAPNRCEVIIPDRQVTGTIQVRATDLTTKNWFTKVESHGGVINKVVLDLDHGTTAGNIFSLDAPAVQLSNMSPVDVNGRLSYNFDVRFIPVNGDDEVTFSYT